MAQKSTNTTTDRGTQIKQTRRDIISRVRFLYTLFIFIGIGIAVRLVWVQVISPSVRHNAQVLNNGIVRVLSIPAHRGTILTREGEPLALSSFRYHAAIDYAAEALHDDGDKDVLVRNVDSMSRMLAAHFNPNDASRHGYKYISAEEYKKEFMRQHSARRDRSRHIFPRAVTTDEWNMIRRKFPILNNNLGIACGENRTDERIYPSGDLAKQLIGVLPDSTKADKIRYGTGIERVYNEVLAGRHGVSVEQRIAHGFWTRIDDSRNRVAEDGCNVITTLDGGLQKLATERLREELEKEHASFGVAMVMEVATGNILCMVNLSSGKERGTNYSEDINHALRTAMCPGSTFKLASAMALLEIGDCDINTIVNIPTSSQKVGEKLVRDTHTITGEDGKALDSVNMRDGFAHSSNIYFAKTVYDRFKDEPERYTRFLEGLLFNDNVGLQSYGEVKSKLPQPGTPEWKRFGSTALTLPQLAYGYILELPPIHTLTFFNGVANNGCMVAPRFIDRVERDGEVVERTPIITLREKMCSSKTIETLKDCLHAASADNRTQYKFRGMPIEFGCKTGTAQIWGSFVSNSDADKKSMSDGMSPKDNYYLGSVVTMFPIDKPKYTVMVCVAKQSTPSHSNYYGISLTGPTARSIMEYIYANDPTLHAPVEVPEVPYAARSIKAGSSDALVMCAERHSREVIDQKGEDGNRASSAAWCKASVGEDGITTLNAINTTDGKVPNVVGMGLSDALYLLESSGLNVTHSGSGRVVGQSLRPGTTISKRGTSINLTLER